MNPFGQMLRYVALYVWVGPMISRDTIYFTIIFIELWWQTLRDLYDSTIQIIKQYCKLSQRLQTTRLLDYVHNVVFVKRTRIASIWYQLNRKIFLSYEFYEEWLCICFLETLLWTTLFSFQWHHNWNIKHKLWKT